MAIIVVLLISIYVLSVIFLGGYYGENNVSPNFWSVVSLFVPIVNSILLIYLSLKDKERIKKFFSLKTFLNELK